MATEQTIIMNFQSAKAQAEELATLASDLRNIGNKDLADSLQKINTYWKGENATNFIGKGNQVKDKITKIADDLDAAATAIKQIAKQTYDAEMAAIELAKQST